MTQPPVSSGWAWQHLTDAERERAFSPSSCIGGHYQPFIDAYRDQSAEARAATAGQLNLPYGPGAAQRLDYFAATTAPSPSAPKPPLLVFIHGGYWQELSKDDSCFAASDCVAQGVAFAALNYTLAPQASVQGMVLECRQAIAWLHQNASPLGFDAQRIVVAGSSAGAHLAAMAALPKQGRAIVQATILVSGIYGLEPLIGTSINKALGLDATTAQGLSPLLLPIKGFPPSVVCWGAVETQAFKQQSLAWADRLRSAGTPCQSFEVPGRNHFDVIMDLARPGTLLGAATARVIAETV